MVWKVADILGTTTVVYSLLDSFFNTDIIEGMPASFRYSIYFLACCYLLLQVCRIYEKHRSERFENNKKEFNWKKEKEGFKK